MIFGIMRHDFKLFYFISYFDSKKRNNKEKKYKKKNQSFRS